MMSKTPLAIAMLAVAASFGAHAVPALNYEDSSVTAIYGGGNSDGDFTTNTQNNIKLGLRAHVRYDLATGGPKNVFGNQANGKYKQQVGTPSGGSSLARWNFDWSVNINADDTSPPPALNSLTYLLGLDTDPGIGMVFASFDPITVDIADHSFGVNGTLNGEGREALTAADYAAMIGTTADEGLTLVQNSWNFGFFPSLLPGFDPTVDGVYSIFLEAFSGGVSQARTTINVVVGAGAVNPPNGVPEPGSLALVGLALAGLAVARKRKIS